MYRLQVTHNDLKPDNIMKTKDGEYKIVDFGLSTVVSSDYPKGTPLYMAPEYIKKYDGYDPILKFKDYTKIDVWSLGVLLYDLTHMVHPYNPSSVEWLRNNCRNDTLIVKTSNLGYISFVSDKLSIEEHMKKIDMLNNIIDGCLAYDPKTRITLSQLKDKLNSIL